MNIPRIELIQLNSVIAANAYKEYAHLLSDSNIKRLADAGLFNKNNSWESSKSMAKGIKAKFMFKGDDPKHLSSNGPHFSPKIQSDPEIEAKLERKAALVGLTYNKDKAYRHFLGRDKIILNRDGLRDILPANKQNMGDVIHHELNENLAVKKGIISNNATYLNNTSHFHPKVIADEFKKYNQTGGSRTRKEPYLWQIREYPQGVEESYIQKYLNTSKRLRNSDYKKAYKDMERYLND